MAGVQRPFLGFVSVLFFNATDATSVCDDVASVGVFVLHPFGYFWLVFVVASSRLLKAKLSWFKVESL